MKDTDASLDRKIADAIEDYLDGQMDEQQLEAFRDLLKENADARKAFCQHNYLSHLLAFSLAGGSRVISNVPSENGSANLRPAPSRSFSSLAILSLAAIAATLLIGIGAFALRWTPVAPMVSQPDGADVQTTMATYEVALRPESAEVPVAVLLGVDDAVWNSEGLENISGIPLRKGWLDLSSGSASIVFDSGAVVTLIGPARFRIDDSHQGYLASGSMVANVPEKAIGFKVRTSAMNLTDLGTEFGIRIGSNNETEVHVIDGLVEVESKTSTLQKSKLEMHENEANRFTRNVVPDKVPMDKSFAEKVVVSRPSQRIGYYTFRSLDNGDGSWTTDPSSKSIGGEGVSFGDFYHVGVLPGPVKYTENLNRWSFKSWTEGYQPNDRYVGFDVKAEQQKRLSLKRLSLELFRAGGNPEAHLAPQDGLLLVSSDGFETQHEFPMLENEDFVLRPKFVSASLDAIPPASEFEFRFVFKGQTKARAIRMDEVLLELELID